MPKTKSYAQLTELEKANILRKYWELKSSGLRQGDVAVKLNELGMHAEGHKWDIYTSKCGRHFTCPGLSRFIKVQMLKTYGAQENKTRKIVKETENRMNKVFNRTPGFELVETQTQQKSKQVEQAWDWNTIVNEIVNSNLSLRTKKYLIGKI